jgi:type IV secretory pathway VirJ component
MIIMISGDGGWKFGVPEFAREFARGGSVVAGVDILRYYKHLRSLNTECYHVFSDFVELATAVERRCGFASYVPPVIMGYSSGATLVYGILAQARPGTFIGGISLGFCPDIELPKMLCQTNNLRENVLKENKSFLLLPDKQLGNRWIVLHGKVDRVCDYKTVQEFISATGNARLVSLTNVGHGFAKWSDFMPQWKEAYAELLREYNKDTAGVKSSPEYENLKRLPLRVIREKAGTSSNMIAIMFSGDGGWYGFEESLSAHLGNYGIPVVGIDIKKYLWNKISPEEAARDVSDIMRYYSKEWNKTGFILFGYSQGAEILPFIYDRLPSDLAGEVKSIVMLSPEQTTDFEIHITNMLGLGNRKNTYAVIPEIKKDTAARQVVVLGDDEESDMPQLLKNTGVEFVTVPGDHHYKGNATLIIQKLKEAGIF